MCDAIAESINFFKNKKNYIFFSCLSRTRFRRLPRFFPASRRNFSLSQLSPCWHWNPDWPTSTGHTFNCLGQCLHLADLKVESEKIEIKLCMRNRICSKYVKYAFQDCDTNLEDHGWIVRVLRSKFSCAHRSPICGWGQVARTGDILPVKKDGYAQQFRPAENFSGFKGQTPFNHWGQNEVPNQFWGQLRARKVCPLGKGSWCFCTRNCDFPVWKFHTS